MITLGIDTSTARGSVALLRDEQSLGEESFWRGGKGAPAGQHLFGAIEKLLSSQQLAPRDIGLIAVGVGPGSFTGIRVGIAAAKGLAMPRQYRSRPSTVSTHWLSRFSRNCRRDCQQMCVFADARRDEIYSAVYDREGRRVRDCKIGALEEIADEIHDPIWFVSAEIEQFQGH